MPKTLKNKVFWLIGLSIFILAAGTAYFVLHQRSASVAPQSGAVAGSIEQQPVVDYNQLGSNDALENMVQERKQAYGIDKGVDLIVKADETLKIGQSTIPMQEIIDQIQLKSGDIVEKDIHAETGSPSDMVYGIYVVQPGDNIWNIHFNFLKDYFLHRGVTLSPFSDEPDLRGRSSGVGKLLKFSENMVYIYNVREHRLDVDIHMIQPLSKIVVYNMREVFALLDPIDYNKVNQIRFDGETIWIPAEP